MAQGGESGVWGLRARGLMLLPASFATLGKSPPLSELQPPVPCHEGGWTSCQRDIESATGWEEGHGERTPRQVAARLGLPLAFVSYWDASVLLGNGLEGGPNGDFWINRTCQSLWNSQPRGCLLSCPRGATLTWPRLLAFLPVAEFSPPRVCLSHLCLLDTVSSLLLQGALPRPPHFLPDEDSPPLLSDAFPLPSAQLPPCLLQTSGSALGTAKAVHPTPPAWFHLACPHCSGVGEVPRGP